MAKRACFGLMDEKARRVRANEELLKFKAEHPNMTRNFYQFVYSSYASEYSVLDRNEMTNLISFIKFVYVSINGTEEGFEEFIDKNNVLCRSKYGDFRFRLALFNHYGFLDEVIEKGYLMLTREYNNIFTTRALYGAMSKQEFKSIDEIRNYLYNLSITEMEELKREYPLEPQEQMILDEELMETLQKRGKKSKFVHLMTAKRK